MRQTIRYLRLLPGFVRDLATFTAQGRQLSRQLGYVFPLQLFPCLEDRTSQAGEASGHYFHQDLYIARRIFQEKPRRHIDVGSRIDGFVAHVASFRELEVLDIRSAPAPIPNVRFVQADLMATLPLHLAGCTDSASCLHALEHFGLGRYGDPIDYEGHIKGLLNLHRMLEPGGRLYLSVPIGTQRVEFNAHRVFAVPYLLELFVGFFSVDRVCAVDDFGRFHQDLPDRGRSFVSHYGCGIFELVKH